MKLLVDVGNSRVKWARLTDRKLRARAAFAYQDANLRAALHRAWRDLPAPDGIYVANVAGRAAAVGVTAVARQLWGARPVFVKVRRRGHGVVNAYHDLSQLGVDRWLALIAAWNLHRSPVCVVSCGTAVTIDGVSATGRHLGGLIIPGLIMMQDRLNAATHGIRIRTGRRLRIRFGRSTADCVRHGATRAVVALINDAVAELSRKYGGSLARVITGGDGRRIESLLRERFDYDPHLVLRGLMLAAEDTP